MSSLLSQLSELQQQVIGGENKRDHSLKAKLTERKRKALRRSDTMAAEYTDWDSEQVIEGTSTYDTIYPPSQLSTYRSIPVNVRRGISPEKPRFEAEN